jgi:hypothetical protein
MAMIAGPHPRPPDDAVSALEQFAEIVDELSAEGGVTAPQEAPSRGFGSSALKVNGSIFAMLTGGHFVVKLPRERVTILIQQGIGAPFDAGKGTPMKEWLTVISLDEHTWLTLARESLAFVGSRSSRHRA